MRYRLFSIVLTVLTLAGVPAEAHIIDTPNTCPSSFDIKGNQPIGAGLVGPGGADVFYDKETCLLVPQICLNDRLPHGGRVLLGRRWRGFVCTYFPRRRNSISGWVKADKIIERPFDHNPPLGAWLGFWTADDVPGGDPYVRFLLRHGVLMVRGDSWTRPPEEHIGALNEVVTRKGYTAYDADCHVTFWLIGTFLLADDHDYPCSGQGAGFYGVYMRSIRKIE